jgi:E3 ubiquitin-protein ligase NEDD4
VDVTASNRREYVELLVEWLLTGSVKAQFEAFRDGFLLMFDPDGLLRLITPRELEVTQRE